MIEQDTIRLLRECDAGVKMGISAIDDVLKDVKHDELRAILTANKTQHSQIENETRKLLGQYNDEGKQPNPIAKGMSWIKTNTMLAASDSDKTIASLMTDGCDMGVKSLGKYLNKYKAADEASKAIAQRLIQLEEKLSVDIRPFL